MSRSGRRTGGKSLFGAAFGLLTAAGVVAAPAASADEWPVWDPSSPVSVTETDNFLTPTDLDYWNPFVTRSRLTSPYGTSTRIVCQSFHGQTFACYQADRDGNPHKLTTLPAVLPPGTGSAVPGASDHWVYPFWEVGF